MTTRTRTMPDPTQRTVVSVNLEAPIHAERVTLVVHERPLDLGEPLERVEVALTWGQTRALFHNLASILTTEMSVREEEA
jgi:hypothetical protein